MERSQQNNQFFLAVTATVALVSIVALVILVLNTASPRAVSYMAPSVEQAADVNTAGDARLLSGVVSKLRTYQGILVLSGVEHKVVLKPAEPALIIAWANDIHTIALSPSGNGYQGLWIHDHGIETPISIDMGDLVVIFHFDEYPITIALR